MQNAQTYRYDRGFTTRDGVKLTDPNATVYWHERSPGNVFACDVAAMQFFTSVDLLPISQLNWDEGLIQSESLASYLEGQA